MPCLFRKLLIPLLSLALFSAGARALVTDPSTLAPTAEQRLATELITGFIVHYHYKKPMLDDAMSAQVLARYLETLDPNRSYFLRSDIDAFSRYKASLDEDLRYANLDPAFEIFRIFTARLTERVDHALTLVNDAFDFDVDESYIFDRTQAPWADSRRQLDEIWRKRIKNDVLSLRLAGQDKREITKILRGRYTRLRAGTNQLQADDVYQMYINAFTQSVEPHTAYLLPRASEDFEIRMSLSLEGIGAVLQSTSEQTVVSEIVTGGPADLSDELHVQDRITGVGQGEDGEVVDVVGWRLDDVVDLIRGPKGSKVRLHVLPRGFSGPPKVITLTRSEVKLEDQAAKSSMIKVSTGKDSARIGVVEVPAFYMDYQAYARKEPDYRSTTRDVRALLEKLKKAKVEGVVVDLRGNAGGSLTEATELTGLFIEDGPIVQVKDPTGHVEVIRDPDPAIAYAGPMAVLVDGLSASASEIFAGAIQDYRRGLVIGEPTFGKGTVQQLVDLNQHVKDPKSDLGQLTTTVAKFYRVSGSSTQNRGVTPDIVYPTAFNSAHQGESALDNALPWDKIHGTEYAPRHARLAAMDKVRKRHVQRVETDPDFDYLLAQVHAFREAQNQLKVSLRASERRKQQDSIEQAGLRHTNRYRQRRDLPPLTQREFADLGGTFDAERVLLKEAAMILHDQVLSSSAAARRLHAADYRR